MTYAELLSKSPSISRKPYLRLLPVLLPLLLLLPSLEGFPYPTQQASYSDIAVSHYPNALFLRDSLYNLHQVPLWSPSILSGYPFAGNPLASLWYPPGWLALLLPLPLGFNLLVGFHLVLGALGMYALLRQQGRSYPASLLAGIAFGMMPKVFAHYGAGHLTLLYAVPWTPWLLWSKATIGSPPVEANPLPRLARFLPSGAVLALIFLADPRWAAFAGATWLGYAIWIDRFSLQKVLVQGALAVLLSAPLAIPLLEYAERSTRANLTVQDSLVYSLPVARLLGLLFPDYGGFHEWTLYPGAGIFLLAILGFAWSWRLRQVRFWALLLLVSLAFALGGSLPGLSMVLQLPGFSLLRVPSRALFLSGMAFAALSAFAMDRLLAGLTQGERKAFAWIATTLCGFAISLAIGSWLLFPTGGGASGALPFLVGSLFLLVSVIWITLHASDQIPARVWGAALLLLICLDLGLVDRSLFAMRDVSQVTGQAVEVAGYLAGQPGLFRVYSPSYSIPQQTAARYQLQLVDGVDPLQLQGYVAYMERATGVPRQGYSVTLPPFSNGEPRLDNQDYQPNPHLLGLLNVRYLAAEFDLEDGGLELVGRYGNTRLYKNSYAYPRAWLQPVSWSLDDMQNQTRPDIGEVKILHWAPNRIEMEARIFPEAGATRLVLSEIAYPGWRVSIDGGPARVLTQGGIFRAVDVPVGKHLVVFAYRPLSVYLGLSLGLIGLFWLIGASWSRK